jgi:diphthamide synthase (EF-2-diphthine--ammonia ligase)
VVNEKYDRVSMHATRRALLQRQAEAAGLSLEVVHLPDPCTNEQCDEIMGRFVGRCAADGIECMAFGDLFLEDVRRYRENQLKGTGIRPLFPLWGASTQELAREMWKSGVEAYVSSVDLSKLPAGVAGRKWSEQLLSECPEGTDPCGENGEFHTVVTGGPMFRAAIPAQTGEIVQRDGFAFADIVPLSTPAGTA